jgi:very-short-patch-repair endonuclease
MARLSKRGRRGVGVLRAVLEERDCIGRSPSVLEAKGRQLLRRGHFPKPVAELIIGPNNEFRLDFAWADVLLAWELDGWEWHSSYEAVRRGKQRNNKLVAQGWAILQHDWFDIVRRPTAVLAELEAIYRERLALLGKQMVV